MEEVKAVKIKNPKLELLAPAACAETAIQAILHGADAVYMGGPSHGARKGAANSLEDIERVADFAHRYRAKVYVTVNTIVYEDELSKVRDLCRDLYHAGADALIVQDMGILRMDLPPIALHASTQCDIRTPEKARFLQDVGFSQIVLARELGLGEIKEIADAVDIPVECFVHGALCVSYSGRCHASLLDNGRSANRGECAQLCRLPYTLKDSEGKILAKRKHLLSLKDFNSLDNLPDLIEAGVSSFKIEGRLKDSAYVKNITALYDNKLNEIIREVPYRSRSSFGQVSLTFTPQASKSFNRGFTDYFLNRRRPESIASLETPKSLGEEIKNLKDLHNGDGISFFDTEGNFTGVNVNGVEKGRIIGNRPFILPEGAKIYRTSDIQWQKQMSGDTAVRKINLDIKTDDAGITAGDERGVGIRIPWPCALQEASNPMDYSGEFAKLGNTVYKLQSYESNIPERTFIPRSKVSEARRQMVSILDAANISTLPLDLRKQEKPNVRYPFRKLDYRDNVSNSLAKEFYRSHGVENMEWSLEKEIHETGKTIRGKDTVVMTTRHCILRELGMCKRMGRGKFKEPLTIGSGSRKFRLHFNCADCEMEVLTT